MTDTDDSDTQDKTDNVQERISDSNTLGADVDGDSDVVATLDGDDGEEQTDNGADEQ